MEKLTRKPWHAEYLEILESELFLSASGYEALTGEPIALASGELRPILDEESGGGGIFAGDASLVTNYLTGRQLAATAKEPLYTNEILFGCYVMNDGDFAALSEGLTSEWREIQVCFNVENCADTYGFAKALFYEIVDRSGPEVELWDSWDPVVRDRSIREEGTYLLDNETCEAYGFDTIDYSQRDSSNFRLYWQYMPQFRVLDKADFIKTTAVFLMLFLFIAIVCFAAVIIIAYTRCMTIALTNAQIYDNLRHLGAPGSYLYQSVRGQVKRVFLPPALTGTALIYAFYILIMLFNGPTAEITASEAAGLLASLLVIAAVSCLLYGVYRLTLGKVCAVLNIRRKRAK